MLTKLKSFAVTQLFLLKKTYDDDIAVGYLFFAWFFNDFWDFRPISLVSVHEKKRSPTTFHSVM